MFYLDMICPSAMTVSKKYADSYNSASNSTVVLIQIWRKYETQLQLYCSTV